MFRRFIFLSLLAIVTSANAQDGKSYVYLYNQCDNDTVGQHIAYKVREGIRRSISMTIADSYEDSAIPVGLICKDPSASDKGNISYFSYSIRLRNTKGYYDYHLTHGILNCGANRVDQCADTLVAVIDNTIGELKKRIADGSFKLIIP